MENKKTLTVRVITFGAILVAIIILMRVVVGATQTSTKYNSFAQCLTDKGLKFYGAFWCPHCQAQKREFGGSVKLLPYIECSTPDGKGQLSICTEAGVEGYPTWIFLDSSVKTGELSLEELAMLTKCPLPQQ